MPSLYYYIEQKNPDIIGISETWFQKENRMTVPGYKCIRRDRMDKKGGGILILTKENTVQETTVISESDNNETIWIRCKIRGKSTTIAMVYRKQESRTSVEKLKEYYGEMEKEVLKALHLNEELIIMGDFNAKLEDPVNNIKADKSGKMLNKLVQKHNLIIVNNTERCQGKWTRINTKNESEKSVIDFMICCQRMYRNVN